MGPFQMLRNSLQLARDAIGKQSLLNARSWPIAGGHEGLLMGILGVSRCPIKLPSGDRPLIQPEAVPCGNISKDCFWPIKVIQSGIPQNANPGIDSFLGFS